MRIKIRRIATFILIAALAASMTACKKDEEVSYDSTQEKDIIKSSALQQEAFSIKFDGIDIVIGETKFKELNEKGWFADETKNDVTTLGKDSKDVPVRITLKNTLNSKFTEGNDIRISLATSKDGSCDIADGVIRSIYICNYIPDSSTDSSKEKTLGELPEMKLPNDVAFGMKYKDVFDKLGKPSEQTDNLSYHSMSYYLNNGQLVVEVESDTSGKGIGLYSINIVGV